MNPFPTFSEGVNKSVHMDVRKLKTEGRKWITTNIGGSAKSRLRKS